MNRTKYVKGQQIEKKNHDLRLRLTKIDKEKIQKRAEECGMDTSSYSRYVLLNTSIKVTIEK